MVELPWKNDFEKLLSSLLFDSQIESQKRTPKSWQEQGCITERVVLEQERRQFYNGTETLSFRFHAVT